MIDKHNTSKESCSKQKEIIKCTYRDPVEIVSMYSMCVIYHLVLSIKNKQEKHKIIDNPIKLPSRVPLVLQRMLTLFVIQL